MFEFIKVRYLDIALVLLYGDCLPLGFSLEEFSFIARSTQAAAIVEGLYSRKAAVRIVYRQNCFDIFET